MWGGDERLKRERGMKEIRERRNKRNKKEEKGKRNERKVTIMAYDEMRIRKTDISRW
jgi:hypothetical protein